MGDVILIYPNKVLYQAPNTISFSGKVMFTNGEIYTLM